MGLFYFSLCLLSFFLEGGCVLSGFSAGRTGPIFPLDKEINSSEPPVREKGKGCFGKVTSSCRVLKTLLFFSRFSFLSSCTFFIFCLAQSDKLEFSLSNLFFPGSLEQSLSVTANEPKTYVRTSTLVRGLTAMPLQMNDTVYLPCI